MRRIEGHRERVGHELMKSVEVGRGETIEEAHYITITCISI